MDGIHSSNSGFNHSQTGDPEGLVGVIEEFGPSIGKDSIFNSGSSAGIGIEDIRLLGNLSQINSDDFGISAERFNVAISVAIPGGRSWFAD